MFYCWFWLAVIVLAVIIEVLTDQLISIWFIPGAIVAIALDVFSIPLGWQIFALLGVSLLGIFFIRRYVTKKLPKERAKTNLDAIIGERCIVIEKVDNFAGCGQVKVKGQIWSARGVGDDDVFEAGDVLHVVAIEGVKVICKK